MAEILLGNIKGETGPQGPKGDKGDTGKDFKILGFYATVEELSATVTSPSIGDAYGVGEEGAYEIYVYSQNKGWVNSGAFQTDINEQAPTYAEATTLESLTSGEKISIAFGKIKKAITELISHIADTTKHITSTERTTWNGKAPSGHGLGDIPTPYTLTEFKSVLQHGSGFYQVDSADDNPIPTSSAWKAMVQLATSTTKEQESGVQLVFPYNDIENPQMWLRAVSSGTAGDWVEMIHSGNIHNYTNATKIEYGTYYGTEATDENGFVKLTFNGTPKMIMIVDAADSYYSVIAIAGALFGVGFYGSSSGQSQFYPYEIQFNANTVRVNEPKFNEAKSYAYVAFCI